MDVHSTFAGGPGEQGVKSQDLKGITEMLLKESNLRTPLHSRRISFLQGMESRTVDHDYIFFNKQIPQ